MDHHLHVGDLGLDHLTGSNRLTEGDAVVGALEGNLEHTLSHAEVGHSDVNARDGDREWMAISMPWPSSPSRYSGERTRLVNFRPAWPAPLQPIMWGIGTISKPGASLGTKNAERRSSPDFSGLVLR